MRKISSKIFNENFEKLLEEASLFQSIDTKDFSLDSDFVYKWLCPKGEPHSNLRTIRKRLSAPQKCSICSGDIIIEGVNDLATVKPELLKDWNDPSDPSKIFWKTSKKVSWKCHLCKEEWIGSVRNRSLPERKGGCAVCSNKTVITGVNDPAMNHPWIKSFWSEKNNKNIHSVRMSDKTKYLWKCPKGESHLQKRTIEVFVRYKKSCSICNRREIVSGVNDAWTTSGEVLRERWADTTEKQKLLKTIHDQDRTIVFKMYCRSGKHVKKQTLKNFMENIDACQKCIKSSGEIEFTEFIKENTSLEIVENDRKLLKGFEIDVLIPDLKVGFEYNGNYWHSDVFMSRMGKTNNHLLKKTLARDKGYSLYFVWENDFKENFDKIKENVLKVLSGLKPESNVLSKLHYSLER